MNKLTTITLTALLLAPHALLHAAEPGGQGGTGSVPASAGWEKALVVEGSHLIVPVANRGPQPVALGIHDGDRLVQSFSVVLPQDGEISWLAAYPLDGLGLKGKRIKLSMIDGKNAPDSMRAAFERISIGAASEALSPSDYSEPYRNQFHASTRRGWNNDPNGMVFHNGKYHLYYQYNPFGISWGNMHWGHFESTDLIHWQEKPIAIYQRTLQDMAYSGNGFVDFNNSSGLGPGTQFAAFTSTGRGECLAYSRDGGLTFTELPENPVVKHRGRDPKVFWFAPQEKWVMVVYDESPCAETETIAATAGPKERNIAFWESKDLRQWTPTGNFTDGDRSAVYECPEMFELPVTNRPGESRWILLAAQNRYFIGEFDGRTFRKESGPHGTTHGAFYAAQTFSDVPDGRRIQMGWVRTDTYLKQFPGQITSQAFTLPHELTLRETTDGLRMFFFPVKEVELLRAELLAEGYDLSLAAANALLRKSEGELSEVLIRFADSGQRQLVVNGIEAGFTGRAARIFTDRTFNEVYADEGISYELRNRKPAEFDATETRLTANENLKVQSLKVFRLRSIWPR